MANEWYYTGSGARHGPISTDELKRLAAEGLLAPTDLIWKPGMSEWTPASRAKELFTRDAVPPELPPGADAGPPPVPEVALAVHAGLRPRTRAKARAARADSASGFWASFTDADEPWSAGWFVALIVATAIVPIIGIVAGIVGVTRNAKRVQGGVLIGIAAVALLILAGVGGGGILPGSGFSAAGQWYGENPGPNGAVIQTRLVLSPDGRYLSEQLIYLMPDSPPLPMNVQGSWRLEGRRLAVTTADGTERGTITPHGSDSFTLTWSNGARRTFRRIRQR